ncbi:hypothetical protein [Parerythrobacter lacustris]|uniref:Replication protein n=1 Tax=Parerythrobacter lacustris TaxID=2969984 RepID=A0ABT1XPL0_9SPHN|nr:hypothetical protein [Parerythrobacter lacustris]MCR2833598.1 hypothetical protein [Parerythrobacter lacustris]
MSNTAPESAPNPLTLFAPVERQKQRSNGWNEAVQRDFIDALANSGSVKAACKKVGRATTGAYQLRRQPDAREFAAAWDAALAYGMLRIEDEAIDRAINGTEETVHYHGELVATRRRYNERLVMFMLRTRLAEKYGADGSGGTAPGQKGAVGKMQLRRLKKKWKAKWRQKWKKKWEAQLPGKRLENAVEGRRLIEQKLGELRQRVLASRGEEWRALTPETRDAYRHYQRLRARDLGCEYEEESHLPSEVTIAAEQTEEAAMHARRREAEEEENAMTLPPPGWREEDAEAPEPSGPRIRTLKDEGW